MSGGVIYFVFWTPQCSASCGGGLQRRLIKCVNTNAEKEQEVEQAQCELETQPENTQKCNLQECEKPPAGEWKRVSKKETATPCNVCIYFCAVNFIFSKAPHFALLFYLVDKLFSLAVTFSEIRKIFHFKKFSSLQKRSFVMPVSAFMSTSDHL